MKFTLADILVPNSWHSIRVDVLSKREESKKLGVENAPLLPRRNSLITRAASELIAQYLLFHFGSRVLPLRTGFWLIVLQS